MDPDDIPVAKSPDTIPQNMNLVLVLDNSGSMYTSNTIAWEDGNDPTITRAQALQTSVAALLTSLAADTALGSVYQIHIVEYNSEASPVGLGTFTINGGTPTSADAAIAALTTIQNPNSVDPANDQYTNYEAGFQQALYWINNGDPLLPGDVVGDLTNQVIFFSDGDPNKYNDTDYTGGDSHDYEPSGSGTVGAATALAQVTGSDGTDELAQLADAGYAVRSVGISVNSGQEERLDTLDSTGEAVNITSGSQLAGLLPSLLTESIPIISATVQEDDLDSTPLVPDDDVLDEGDEDDNADGINEDLSDDADEANDAAGNLSELFMVGADEELTFSLKPDGDLPTLYSGGEEVTYNFSTPGVLVASAGGETVFTFTVGNDGAWSFDLDGKLDHVAGDGENFALVSGDDQQDSVDGIDLSSVILATDADGDAVPATPGAFVIQVQDDEPDAEGAVGYTFGSSSYTGTDDFIPTEHQVVFNILAEYGADGPDGMPPTIALLDDDGGRFDVVGGTVVFTPDESWSGQSEITYEITDGDGDTAQATLKVIENKLIVGQNVNDRGEGNPNQPYVVGVGADGDNYGEIDGGAGNDILIGDYGGTREGATTANHNVILILDNSGSMWYETNSIEFDDGSGPQEILRIDGLKAAVKQTLDTLALSDATEVRVHLVEFNSNSGVLGTFNLKTGTGLVDAKAAVDSMVEPSEGDVYTNYEAGFQAAEAYIASNGFLPDGSADTVVNQTVFISDGSPNRHYG